MKTATVTDLEERPAEIIALLENGEPVEITRDGRRFAVVTPSMPDEGLSTPDWKTREALLEKAYPEPVKGSTAEELIDYLRGENGCTIPTPELGW